MGKQLQLSQIQESLKRRKDCFSIISTLQNLEQLCTKEHDSNLLEIIPIKIVACFEEYFRIRYSEIIDNAAYRKRIKEVEALRNLKFDFDILGAFQDNAITLGNYLSYLIPCSKLEDITCTLTKLLGIDFIEKIKEQSESALKSVTEIFRLRHIFCHEVPKSEKLSSEKMLELLNEARDFLSIAEKIIGDVLYPNPPQTTSEMVLETGRMFNDTEKELNSLIGEIKSKDLEENLTNAQFDYLEDWKRYREARARSEASIVEGGSMYPIVYTLCLTTITNAFIKELSEKYKYLLRK